MKLNVEQNAQLIDIVDILGHKYANKITLSGEILEPEKKTTQQLDDKVQTQPEPDILIEDESVSLLGVSNPRNLSPQME